MDESRIITNDQEQGDFNICEQVNQQDLEQTSFLSQLEIALTQLQLASPNVPLQLRHLLENVYNLKSTFFTGILSPSDKSLLFSVQSLLQLQRPGVCVIVTPNHSSLKEKLWRINSKVSWVAINNQVSQQQRVKTLAHLESGGFKLIFVHPEILHSIEIHSVSLLVFDEPQSYISKLPFQNQLWSVDMEKVLQDLQPQTVQFLAPLCTSKESHLFMQSIDHPLTFVSQTQQTIIKSPLTVSRDNEHLQHLVQLLRSPRLFRKSGIIIFCDSRSQVEESNAYLISKGLKCSCIQKTSCEQKRQAHFYDFAKGHIEILIVTAGTLFPQGFRHFINLTIHLYLPRTIETFLFDINEINSEGNSHVFLNADSYLKGRNKITAEFVSQGSIENLIKTLQPNKQKNSESEFGGAQVSIINLQQKSLQSKMTKEQIIEIVNILLKQKLIQNFSLIPLELIIRIPLKADNDHPMIQAITKCSKRCVQTNISTQQQDKVYRCSVALLQLELGITPKEIIMQLKEISLRKEVNYSVCEENLCIQTNEELDLQTITVDLVQHFRIKVSQSLDNYDSLYKALQVSSFQTLDYMWKQVKLKQIDYNSQFLQLLDHDCSGYEMKGIIPFVQMSTQREKTNFLADVQIIRYEYDNEQMGSFASDCLIILQGIETNNLNSWRSSNLWKKYWKCKYETLYQIISESITNLRGENPKKNNKKVKPNE